MYIRTTNFTYDPAQEEELLRITDAQLIPAFRRQPGFQRYTIGFDRAKGCGIAVSLWSSAEHDQVLHTATRDSLAHMIPLGLVAEPAQLYEIVRQVLADSTA